MDEPILLTRQGAVAQIALNRPSVHNAFDAGLIVLSTQPTRDGFAGDQTLFAPPFPTPDDDLAEMVSRFAASVSRVANEVESELPASAPVGGGP